MIVLEVKNSYQTHYNFTHIKPLSHDISAISSTKFKMNSWNKLLNLYGESLSVLIANEIKRGIMLEIIIASINT